MKQCQPELPDEIFVGNIASNDKLSNLVGVEYRIGDQAYDIHGKKLPKNYMLPLYIKKSSRNKYNDIMQAELEKIRRGL